MSRSPIASALAALVLLGAPACTPTDPKDPQTWIAQFEKKDPKKVIDAARELRKMKAKEAVQPLMGLLKHEDMGVREEAAYGLAEIGDTAAVDAIVDAIDLASSAKGAERANARFAEALGTLGDKKATPALVKMTQSKDGYVKLAAVDALGKLKDPAALPTLLKFVEDEGAPPLITKKAIIALGEMRAEGAVKALERAMVMERQGVSFFSEASFALFQIGAPSAVGIAQILAGDDKPYLEWADQKGRAPAGYLSKGAIVLADLGEASAVPALVKLMGWKDPDENDVFQMLVRGTAAEALGRLRAKEGAAPIAAQIGIPEANIREKFAIALGWIGDKSVLPKLEAAAKNPKDSWTARQSALTGIALLGDAKNKAVFEAALKSEGGDNAVKNCLKEPSGPTELEAMKQQRCEKEREARPKFLNEELGRLMAGDECKQDSGCWLGKLKDKNPRVRERAAYELGKAGDAKAVDALVEAAKDDELGPRRAAFVALDWFTKSAAAKDALKAKLPVLAKQYEEEKGRAHTFVVNEDLKRVVWKLKQL